MIIYMAGGKEVNPMNAKWYDPGCCGDEGCEDGCCGGGGCG